MLSERDQQTFDELIEQFHNEAIPPNEGCAAKPTPPPLTWVLDIALWVTVAAIAVFGLVGSPEGVISFVGATLMLACIRYAH